MNDSAIIFDCDGVLVDSEALSARVMVEMAAEMGLTFGESEALWFIRGRKVAEWVDELSSMSGRSLADWFVPEFRARCTAAFDRELVAVEHVEEVLRGLDVPFCVASSSPREKILHTLGRTGLLRHFDGHIHSAYELGAWKPDPALFLHAARSLGTRPERCAVVEDSPVGVRAGVRAGMTVFGYAPLDTAAALLAEGATTFRSMRRLPALLAAWRSALPAMKPV